MDLQNLVQDIVELSSQERSIESLKKLKRAYASQAQLSALPTNMQVLKQYRALVDQ